MVLVQMIHFNFAQKFLLWQMILIEQRSGKFNVFFKTEYTNLYKGNKVSWQINSVSESAQLTYLENYEEGQQVSS